LISGHPDMSKLVMAASKPAAFKKGHNQLPKVIKSFTFRKGVEVDPQARAAA
jgi:hypothetical protein